MQNAELLLQTSCFTKNAFDAQLEVAQTIGNKHIVKMFNICCKNYELPSATAKNQWQLQGSGSSWPTGLPETVFESSPST